MPIHTLIYDLVFFLVSGQHHFFMKIHTICWRHQLIAYKYKFWMKKNFVSVICSFFNFFAFITFDEKTFERKLYLLKVVYVECFLYDAIWYHLEFVEIIFNKEFQMDRLWRLLYSFTHSVSIKLNTYTSLHRVHVCSYAIYRIKYILFCGKEIKYLNNINLAYFSQFQIDFMNKTETFIKFRCYK